MPLRYHGIFVVLCVGVTVARASFPSNAGSGVRCMLNSVGLMLSLPEMTHQWSLLELNFWSNRAASKAVSNELLEQDAIRFSRVLNFFPVPVEEECLSEDKRRQGICMNTYECRIQRGVSHGPCALGFGVCCISWSSRIVHCEWGPKGPNGPTSLLCLVYVLLKLANVIGTADFTASCDNEVQNNLTYVTSPGFPNLIDRPMNCTVVVRKIDTEVSQLRIDFVHFNIGQPNATTGVCDGDVMVINNSKTSFELCGWNSGQHVYVDASEGNEPITLNFRLPSGLQSRMWEMRVVQLGFEQRAPVGCLQYFRSPNGTLRTFNYLPNGRYLAGHDYLLCVRQERDMCGIAYQPCTRDSFRIGPDRSNATNVLAAPAATNNGNASASAIVDLNNVANNSITDVVEGSGAGSPEQQEMVLTTGTNGPTSPIERRCRDRIIIPCDFEEFITPGNNVAGVCNLEHCGNSLCRRDELDAKGNCRVETWTTPFRIRVAFDPGSNADGTLADNAGMCLTYQQLACVA